MRVGDNSSSWILCASLPTVVLVTSSGVHHSPCSLLVTSSGVHHSPCSLCIALWDISK